MHKLEDGISTRVNLEAMRVVTLTPLEEKVEDIAIGVDWANDKGNQMRCMFVPDEQCINISNEEYQAMKEYWERIQNGLQRFILSCSHTVVQLAEQADEPIIVEEKK